MSESDQSEQTTNLSKNVKPVSPKYTFRNNNY
jgi:hypothetical protein